MHVESYKVNIIAIADFVEQLSIQKISHSTNMINQRNTLKIYFPFSTPSKNEDKITSFLLMSSPSVVYKLLQHQVRTQLFKALLA